MVGRFIFYDDNFGGGGRLKGFRWERRFMEGLISSEDKYYIGSYI